LAAARILIRRERGIEKHPELKRQRKLWSRREESNLQPAVCKLALTQFRTLLRPHPK
jgi:hypothetical protein